MIAKTCNPEGCPVVVFIGGWGQRLDSPNTRWLLDVLTTAGMAVHAFELPTGMTDLHREYVEPVARFRASLGPHGVLSHSAGGLVAAHALAGRRGVYLSPWWGLYGGKLRARALQWCLRLPLRARLLPIDFTRDELGDLVTDEDWAALPKRVSPRFVAEIARAQAALPPVAPESLVFCSLRETIVGLDAIARRVRADRIVLYEGGHELYSSSCRETFRERIVEALRGD